MDTGLQQVDGASETNDAGTPRAALQGICWQHERCLAAVGAASAEWRRRTGEEIRWDARPLTAFNDQPLGELVGDYDLLIVDHPFTGTAAATGALAALDALIDAGELRALAVASMGRCHESYAYGGHQWALAVDAACQVSAAREDLLAAHGVARPASWPATLALAAAHPGAVALPLAPADALCSLLTLCALRGEPVEPGRGVSVGAVEALAALAARVDRGCFEEDAPTLLARAAASDEVLFVPLVFGYAVYAPALRFGPVPGQLGGDGLGPILGGAGIAVSGRSARPDRAAAFAAWMAGERCQRDVIAPAGGQPAHAAAWRDPTVDARAGGFYSATASTLERAWLRPREPWWPDFPAEAAVALAEDLRAGREPAAIARRLDRRLQGRRP